MPGALDRGTEAAPLVLAFNVICFMVPGQAHVHTSVSRQLEHKHYFQLSQESHEDISL